MAAITSFVVSATRTPFTLKHALFAIMGVMTIVVLAGDVSLLDPHHPYRVAYENKVGWVLLPHLLPGLFALLVGPAQFSTRLRRAYPKTHRMLGRAYVGAVLFSAPMGLLIPFVGPKDLFFTIGVCVHASVWFLTTLMAFLTARSRLIPLHKQWVVRSYALTFSFVVVRSLGFIWRHITISEYGVADVIMSFSYVLIADMIFSFQDIGAKKAGMARTAGRGVAAG